MVRKFRHLYRKLKKPQVLLSLLGVGLIIAVLGQSLGWWSDIYRYLSGTVTGPSSVEIASFTATSDSNGVVLRWETKLEDHNKGFNVHRSEDHPDIFPYNLTQLNQALIPTQVVTGTSGAVYQFVDTGVLTSTVYYYWLENVDIYDVVALRGTIAFEAKAASAPPAMSFSIFMPLIQR